MRKILLLLGTLILFAGAVFAYGSPRWASFPVGVYIPESPNSSAVKSAFETWQSGSNGIIRFRYVSTSASASRSPITVVFADTLDSYNKGAVRISSNYGFIYRAEIRISTLDETGQPRTYNEIKSIALHELGKALGLNVNTNENDIMNPIFEGSVTSLSADNKDELYRIYKEPSRPRDNKLK